jgi:putative resolvase
MKLLNDKPVQIILVEHRDRLMRFGVEYVESALASYGRKLLVADPEELKDDLVQDMTSNLSHFLPLFNKRYSRQYSCALSIAELNPS